MTEPDPCSTGSSRASRSASSSGSRDALSAEASPWTRSATALSCAAVLAVYATGCARTVFVSESTPMRIGPMVTGRIYHRIAGEWVLSQNAVPIPEGWYLVPPSFVEEEQP